MIYSLIKISKVDAGPQPQQLLTAVDMTGCAVADNFGMLRCRSLPYPPLQNTKRRVNHDID